MNVVILVYLKLLSLFNLMFIYFRKIWQEKLDVGKNWRQLIVTQRNALLQE